MTPRFDGSLRADLEAILAIPDADGPALERLASRPRATRFRLISAAGLFTTAIFGSVLAIEYQLGIFSEPTMAQNQATSPTRNLHPLPSVPMADAGTPVPSKIAHEPPRSAFALSEPKLRVPRPALRKSDRAGNARSLGAGRNAIATRRMVEPDVPNMLAARQTAGGRAVSTANQRQPSLDRGASPNAFAAVAASARAGLPSSTEVAPVDQGTQTATREDSGAAALRRREALDLIRLLRRQ